MNNRADSICNVDHLEEFIGVFMHHVRSSAFKSFHHFAKVASADGVEVRVPAPRSYVIKTFQNKLIEDWESWWSNSNTGLRVKSFFPKPSLDINAHSSYVTQFLTNRGPFVSYLHHFKLKTTPGCLCGSVGDADHYVFACLWLRISIWSLHLKMLKKPGSNLSLEILPFTLN
ncbi:uncharacterized protein TNCV_862921 [Trichonephila clavipes]|nr:uncharacterized protein TNCV_862921 [Trichonephila clavipes]